MSRRVQRKKIEEPNLEEEPEEMELDEDDDDESSFYESGESDSEPEVTLNILERQPRITAGMTSAYIHAK
jgi:hypothetical protein